MAQKVETDKLIGQILDKKYKVEALVARGGMAKVYKALQTNLNRPVAIKVLDPKHVDANDPQFRERFELEAQMTSQLNHPNTVTIHDYGYSEEFDCFYFIMEFIKGKTLRREMKEVGCFPVERALYIAQQISRSVRQAHSVGVIHRDLKPSNVLLTSHDDDRDWVKVVDFGLLKLRKESVAESSKGVLMGSPRYMSPEQIKRDELDHRSDAYSLGVNLYQMLAGRPPFIGEKAMDILMGHLNDPPEMFSTYTDRDDVPEEVESFTMQMLAKKASDRPEDLEEVIEALGRLRKMVRRKDSIAPPPVDKEKDEGSQPKEIAADLSEDIEEIGAQSSVPASWSDTVPQQDLVGPITGQSSSPVMTPSPEQEQPQSRKIGWIVIASLIILALGGGAIVMIFMMDPDRNGKAAKQPLTPAKIIDTTPPEETSPPPPIDENTPPPIQTFKVAFTTDPEGADVFEGDAQLCTTPCDTEWIVVEGEGEARKFVLIKEGFEQLEIVENVPKQDIDISVDLFPVPGSSGKKPGVKIPGKNTKAPGKKPPSGDDPPPPGKKKKSLGLDEEFPE